MDFFENNPLVRRVAHVEVASRFDGSIARKLREECDDVRTFTEGGQFYILGYKGKSRVVYAFSDPETYRRTMHPTDEDLRSYPGAYRRGR